MIIHNIELSSPITTLNDGRLIAGMFLKGKDEVSTLQELIKKWKGRWVKVDGNLPVYEIVGVERIFKFYDADGRAVIGIMIKEVEIVPPPEETKQ